MNYPIAPLFCRPWTLNGISPQLIEGHYEHHYGAAVQRLNAIRQEIDALERSTTPPVVIHRLKRDELELLNSTLLHELYFASLGGDGRVIPPPMEAALTRDFGSVDRWRQQFMAMAAALAGGSGWVLLSYLPRDAQLITQSASEHGQTIAGAVPILALDMYEHAYQLEFGANATAYIAAFMRNIDWNAVQARYEDALKVPASRQLEQNEFGDLPSISPEDVRSMLESGTAVHIIDVRPRHYATRSHEILEGAVWRDPERVAEWIDEVPRDEPVVTFCVYGFHIGCRTADTLRKAGIDARYMSGGHFGWKAIKGQMKLFE
ncbi:MAG: Fe-Mn family superoxide dismutase [Longimicrobiales bacterium]